MAFLRRKNPTPDPVLSAIDDLMTFSAQALEVSREEARVSSERLAMLEELGLMPKGKIAADRVMTTGFLPK